MAKAQRVARRSETPIVRSAHISCKAPRGPAANDCACAESVCQQCLCRTRTSSRRANQPMRPASRVHRSAPSMRWPSACASRVATEPRGGRRCAAVAAIHTTDGVRQVFWKSGPPTHRGLRAGPAINGIPTAPQALYPPERAAAKPQARLVFGRWFGVERWSKIACSNRGSNFFEASQNSRLEGATSGHSMAPQATKNLHSNKRVRGFRH